MAEQIEKPFLLVVEGRDEQDFFNALMQFIEIDSIQIKPIGGKTNIKRGLKALTLAPEFDTVRGIGIIRDADGNPKGAFDSVCSALQAADLNQPAQPLTFISGDPRTGVMVMPPEPVGTGYMLEDLCLASVGESEIFACVERYIACLVEAGTTYEAHQLAKARLVAFLAAQSKPDARLGIAAQRGVWDFDHPVFEPVKAFLRGLAND